MTAPISGLDPLAAMPFGVGAVDRSGELAPVPQEGAFESVLSQAVSGLSSQLNDAEALSELAATGALPDPTMALVEVEKADLSFQLALQVRNRLVEGWQEISRMGA